MHDQAPPERPAEGLGHEGGHMSSRFGRIVRRPAAEQPYMVILSHDDGANSERGFPTMREAEAFIRRNTPRPRSRSTFWDRAAPEERLP
jgi:hypothetical protein